MEIQPVSDTPLETRQAGEQAGSLMTFTACVAGACIPGLGHGLLGKWDRAVVFFSSIAIMVTLGIQLQGRLFGPDFVDLFSALKFIAEAGSGLFYWIPLLREMDAGNPAAYTYDYANVFLYVAGLLNMLVVVDVFDIARGRKQ